MERRLNVLWADDDDAFAMLMQRIAAGKELAARCIVHRVSDGTEALDYAFGKGDFADRIRFPIPDVILLDQRMTSMDGSEALVEIKKDARLSTTPICIFSTSTQDKLRQLCYGNAATFCVQKPLEYEDLELKVKLMVHFFMDVLELPAK